MAFTDKNLKAYQRSTNLRYANGGKVKETPQQKLARYTATYGAKGKKMFEDEAIEEAKKMPIPFYKKEGPNYEPAPAVKKTKAVLAAGSLANSGNILGPLFSVAGSTYDAGTAIKHLMAGDNKEAKEDALQALIGVIPGVKGVKGLKGEQILSKLEKFINSGIGATKAGSDVENMSEAFATGGFVGDEEPTTPPKPKTKLTPEQIKEKYKSNPNLRYTWGDALEKTFPISGGKVKDVVKDASKQAGVDPSLLYASAMEEGMSLSLRDPNGVSEAYLMATGQAEAPKGRKLKTFNQDDFPIDGFYNYGLDTFGAKYDKLKKKGYLPEGFDKRFTTMDALNEKNELMTSAAFKSDKDALIAKAAMLKDVQDTLESKLAKSGTKLTPKQKQFFMLAGYNAGEGNMDKMIQSYKDKGYLKDDKFLDPNFKPASYAGVWNNVQRRLTNMDILQNEGFLDWGDQQQQQLQQQTPDMANKKPTKKFATGGEIGDEEGNPTPAAPKGYKPLSSQQRSDWNGFVRYLNRDLKVGGDKSLDDKTKNTGLNYLKQYAKANPNFSITPDMVPYVQYEFQQLKNANSLPDQTIEGSVKTLVSDYFKDRDVSGTDGWIGSLTSRQGYPEVQAFDGDPNKKVWGLDYTGASGYDKEWSKKKVIKQGFATGGMAGGGWSAAASALPAVGGLIESLINKPSVSSTQPIMNAQAIHNMSNPYDSPGLKYAMGGEMGDVDDDQYFDWLEQMFDNTQEAEDDDEFINLQDETVEEGQDNDEGQMFDDSEGEDGYFAVGGTAGKKKGIYIKPSKRGTFTAAAKKHGKSVQGFARQVLANKGNYSSAMVKKANFARNASKWKHAYGGWAGMLQAFAMGGTNKFNRYYYAMGGDGATTPIEVEGEEIVETPDGQMQQMQGPSHEEGGIPMNVPEGTKIYSDRLKVEGQSMQQRKAKRERQMSRLDKILAKNPTDALIKNTYKATKMAIDMEDAQDMELQNAANAIYSGQLPKRAMGGAITEKKYATGGPVGNPVDDYFGNLLGYGDIQVPYAPGNQPTDMDNMQPNVPYRQGYMDLGNSITQPVPGQPSTALQGKTPTLQTRNIPTASGAEEEFKPATGFTTGDYIGLGANIFGAIAPILNTRNAAAARKPNLNRYIGVGKDAIDANDLAQNLVGRSKANAMRDLETSTGSAFARNRMGARSINTQRALDTATQIAKDKAAGQIEQTGNDQLIGLLGQRGQLTNWRDQMQAAGATERDVRDTQDTDNYYSNMAENLANFATQVGNIGRNLNVSQGNKDNTALLEQMSEYFDFGRDKSGKLVIKNKKGN